MQLEARSRAGSHLIGFQLLIFANCKLIQSDHAVLGETSFCFHVKYNQVNFKVI